MAAQKLIYCQIPVNRSTGAEEITAVTCFSIYGVNKTQGIFGRPNRGSTEFCGGIDSTLMLILMLTPSPRFKHKLNQLS